VSALAIHVALSTELVVNQGHYPPDAVAWLFRKRPDRSRFLPFLTVPTLIGIQILVASAIVQPDRIAGPTGQAVAAAELVASICWLALLGRWWRRH
jgi:hypothetical protein